MTGLILGLSVLLGLSVAINAILFDQLCDAREQALDATKRCADWYARYREAGSASSVTPGSTIRRRGGVS